ncbi:MAG: hypothetical protein ACTS5A_02680 [Candidatus Hodgkinia cicadicola]
MVDYYYPKSLCDFIHINLSDWRYSPQPAIGLTSAGWGFILTVGEVPSVALQYDYPPRRRFNDVRALALCSLPLTFYPFPIHI